MRHGGHVRCVSLEYDTVERHGCGKRLGQVALLERQHAADAQHETVERQQLLRFVGISREAVEDAAGQLPFVFAQYLHHLVLRLAAMNHQRQPGFDSPLHLHLEGSQLLDFEFARPVEV